jgi:hypothetical protein
MDNHFTTIQLGGADYKVSLNGHPIAEEFFALLPFDTTVSKSGGHHYWGSIPRKLSTPDSLATSSPKEGGLYYADHLTAIAVFYGHPGSIAPFTVYHLGDIVGDLSSLANGGPRLRLSARSQRSQ